MGEVSGTWQPISAGQAEALNLVQESVQVCLQNPGNSPYGASLAQGAAGLAVFFGYRALCRLGNQGRNEALMVSHLEAAMEGLDRNDPSLFSGYTGVAWAIDHLQDAGLVDAGEDLNEQVDDHILAQLERGFPHGLAELISGLAGVGVYALGRLGRGRSEAILDRVVLAIERLARTENDGISWLTPAEALPEWQRAGAPDGYYNLGLAHGIGGVIGFLGRATKAGHPRSETLLEGAVNWLLAREVRTEAGSRFCSWEPVGRTGLSQPIGRLSWCYGSLGLSLALYGAGRCAGRNDWCEQAYRWAKQCAAIPVEAQSTWDGCLCHGAFGNAHLFNRLYQATDAPEFRKAACDWIDRGMALRRPTPVLGGLLALIESEDPSPDYDPWQPLPGLLEGASGAALVLMAAAHPVPPAWDAFLLVDLPEET